jgi:RNA polymerase sigma-70 factor (ECF subfamily)
MDSTAIEQLLDKLNSGDDQATAQVFRAYEPYLRKVVRRRLPAQARARFESSDVLQSVWADLLVGFREGRWRFSSAGQLRAFLIRVVQCRLYDRAGRVLNQARREQPLAQLSEPPASEPRPSEAAQAESVWQKLLACCPPEHGEVLRLRRLGFTLQEIADRTGLHEGSVRRILRQLAREAAFSSEEPGVRSQGSGVSKDKLRS